MNSGKVKAKVGAPGEETGKGWRGLTMKRKPRNLQPIAGSKRAIADRYGIGLNTVERLIDSGKLRAFKCRRRVLIKFVDADRAILGEMK